MVQPPDQYVGENVESTDQIELLENHRRRLTPIAQRLAPYRCHIDAIENNLSRGRRRQPVDHSQ